MQTKESHNFDTNIKPQNIIVGEYAYFDNRFDGSEVPFSIVEVESGRNVWCHFSLPIEKLDHKSVICYGIITNIKKRVIPVFEPKKM